MQREGKIGLVIAVAVVIVVIAIIASMIYFDNPQNNLPTNPNGTTSSVIIPSGTQFDINYGGYQSYAFQVNETMTLSGSFSSSSTVILYVITGDQYQQFLAGTPLSNQQVPFGSGSVSNYNVTFNLSPGTYYLVFMNANQYSGVTVYINNAFQLSDYYVT